MSEVEAVDVDSAGGGAVLPLFIIVMIVPFLLVSDHSSSFYISILFTWEIPNSTQP